VAEVSRIGNILVLVQEVLKERYTTIEVDVDTFTELLLTLNGSHHGGLRHGVFGGSPLLILGILNELAELFVEVETDIEIEIVSLLIEMDQADTLGGHVSIFDYFPGNSEDEFSLGLYFGPVGIQECNGLLLERLVCNLIEVLKGFFVKFLGEGHL